MSLFFIADLHFRHPNMAARRGFQSDIEHDNYIIEKWNKVISKRDSVWILGDITMEKKQFYSILDNLKGYKRIVGGNHDQPQHTIELLKYVGGFCGCFKLDNFILTHIPIHPFELDRFVKNIHGHVHEKSLEDKRYINVSCEAIDYTPISLEQIKTL